MHKDMPLTEFVTKPDAAVHRRESQGHIGEDDSLDCAVRGGLENDVLFVVHAGGNGKLTRLMGFHR